MLIIIMFVCNISIHSLADVKAAEGFIKVLTSNNEKRCQK